MIGQKLNNRYTITSLLGEGAMGEVYLATDEQTGQQVAVKILSHQLGAQPEALERFRREAETLRQLDHPNIVKFVDAFDHEEQFVIVMEYLPGGSLHDVIKAGALSIERSLQIVLDLSDALIRAHRLNIIHRDIKPENVLLDKNGTPKLADFGVAHLEEGTRMTRTGTQVGTPYYMSPEAWEGKPLDAQADIWSLGVMFFEMLAGKVPFSGDSGAVVMNKVLTTPPPDLKKLRLDVPAGLIKIVSKMLARDKNRRYTTMRQVGVDLESHQQATALRPAKTKLSIPPKAIASFGSPKLLFVAGLGIVSVIFATRFLFLSSDSPTPTPTVTAITVTEAPKDTPAPTESLQQEATPIPTKGFPARIAYVIGQQEVNGAIYVADSTGSNSRNLTGNDCNNAEPNWAPDGQALVYQSNCGGSYDILRILANGSGRQPILEETDFDEREAHFSPSGDSVVYVRHPKGESYNTNGDIRIYEFGGDDHSTGLQGRGPVYSPDGTRLAYMSFDGTTWQIFIYDLSTKRNRQITFGQDDSRWPTWSPDNQFIAFNSATGQGTTPTGIWIIPVEAGEAVSIASDGYYGRPSWSDTGQIIFNAADGLWVVNPDGSDLRQLTEDHGWAGVWSR